LVQTYNKHRQQIPLLIKNKILKKLTERLSYDDSSISIHVNRKKARDFIESGKVDEKGEHTVFSQVMKGL
jgi:DNA-binding MarR family transcriptional regulator